MSICAPRKGYARRAGKFSEPMTDIRYLPALEFNEPTVL